MSETEQNASTEPEFKTFEDVFGDGDLDTETDDTTSDDTPDDDDEEDTDDEDASDDDGDEEDEPSDSDDDEDDAEDDDEDEEEEEKEQDGEGKSKSKKKDKDKSDSDDGTPKTWKIVVDGEEREVSEQDLVQGYATAQASSKRFQEAKQLHEEATTFYQHFLTSPGDALTDLVVKKTGGNRMQARERVRDIFLEWMAPELEESLIEDENERRLYRERREIEEERKELDNRKSESDRKAAEDAEKEFVRDLKVTISDNLKKHSLPDETAIWVRVGTLLDAAQKAGMRRDNLLALVPSVTKQVVEERMEQAKALVPTLTPEELKKMFPEAVEALKKERIEKVKRKKTQKTPSGSSKPKPRRGKQPPKPRTFEEVFGD